jgi:hypothetical protein
MKGKIIWIIALSLLLPVCTSYESVSSNYEFSSAFEIEIVDFIGDVGLYTSLVVDENGWQYCSYYDKINGDLKYAVWDGEGWYIEVVDSIGDVGMYTSLALDRDKNPHISYYDNTNHDLKYARRIGELWHIEVIDSDGDVGWSTSIALDAYDRPHISYHDFTNNKVKYATLLEGWYIEVVDDGGPYTSIGIKSTGITCIAYTGSEGLRFAERYEMWMPITVDAEAEGWDVSLAIDHQDRVHISYYGNGYIKYATGYYEFYIEDVDYVTYGGWGSSIDVHEGIPSISYYEYLNKDLRYARRSLEGWSIEIVDAVGDVGWHSSLCLKDGLAHITYYDITNGDLKKAKEIEKDTEPPTVVIEYPPDGSTFTEPNITVKGYVIDNVGIVSIGMHHEWEDGEVSTSSTLEEPLTFFPFEWDFTLYEGWNRITIFAQDEAQNYGEDTVIYTVSPFVKVNLTIYNGLEGTGGGQQVPESVETTRGAFTVTNIQDTNGDGIKDKDQNPVEATPIGRDEVDLMKMILHKPEGKGVKPNDNVELIKSGPNKDAVKLWDSSTKNKEIPPTHPPDKWVFKVKDLPKEVWVEIREEDPKKLKMRGITFTLKWFENYDKVKATGIWAEVTEVKHDRADAWNAQVWPDMPQNVRDFIDNSGGFGLRRYQDIGWRYGNVIGFQFTVYPPGIGNEEGVYFDITRQIHFHDRCVPRNANPNTFPNIENWPNRVELPNDDRRNIDESDRPSAQNHMYSIDTPSFAEGGWGGNTFLIISDNNFLEFMRVRFDGTKPEGETVQGSRCSDYFPWHAAFFLWRSNPGQVTRRQQQETHVINCVGPGFILILDFNPPWRVIPQDKILPDC